MPVVQLEDLEAKYKSGVHILQKRGYYDRLISEVRFLVKYIDRQFFFNIFSENLFSDMRGVFGSFVRQDLQKVYDEISGNASIPLSVFLEREYMSLTVLRRCTTNLRYQVKSLIRLPQVKELEFKSSFLQGVSRKFNGEIQELYKLLSQNYKKYFRLQFTSSPKQENRISLACIEKLKYNFDDHFVTLMQQFYQLSDALKFVDDLFKMELENEIKNRIATIYFERQDRLEKLIDYFIDDLKKNFIKTMERSMRGGKNFSWIQMGFEHFIQSDRFETLLRRVIFQSLASMQKEIREEEPAAV